MTASLQAGRVGAEYLMVAPMNWRFSKVAFLNCGGRKVAFLNCEGRKVAFLNLARDEPANREEPS